MSEHDKRASFITEHGTYINLGLGIILLLSTVTGVTVFVRGMAQVEASNGAVQKLQASADETNKSTNELNKNLVIVQGDLRNLTEKIGALQVDTKQTERDSQTRTAEIVRLQSEVQGIKDRLAATEATVRAMEARLLSLEIAVSSARAGSAPPARSGSE